MNKCGWMGFKQVGVAFAAGLLFAGVVFGEVSTADKGLLDRLNSPEWAVREAASTELSGQAWDLDRLQGLYQSAGSVEARERILTCARHQYFSKLMAQASGGQSGRLGILRTPQPVLIQPVGSLAPVRALFVASPICGMPSAVVLKPGDRILKVDQTDLTLLPADAEPFDALTKRVLESKAGDVLAMVIERDGQRMEVQVPVGSLTGMSAVEQPGGFGPRKEVLEAWAREKRKITGVAP
jgi:hypothetical protein